MEENLFFVSQKIPFFENERKVVNRVVWFIKFQFLQCGNVNEKIFAEKDTKIYESSKTIKGTVNKSLKINCSEWKWLSDGKCKYFSIHTIYVLVTYPTCCFTLNSFFFE